MQQQYGIFGQPQMSPWGLAGAGQMVAAPQQRPAGPGLYVEPPDWYKPQNYWAEGDYQPMDDPFKVFGTISWLLGGKPGEDGTMPRYEQFVGAPEKK